MKNFNPKIRNGPLVTLSPVAHKSCGIMIDQLNNNSIYYPPRDVFVLKTGKYRPGCTFFVHTDALVLWIISVNNFQLLTPAHKGWGYSRPLCRLGGGGGSGGHKACVCSTA